MYLRAGVRVRPSVNEHAAFTFVCTFSEAALPSVFFTIAQEKSRELHLARMMLIQQRYKVRLAV